MVKKREFLQVLHFVTLCCGILTLKTSDSFFRSFRFLRQNGAFSAMEQNQTYKNSLFVRRLNTIQSHNLLSAASVSTPIDQEELSEE